MLDKVNDHLAVIVGKNIVAVFRKENFKFVGVADISVVCSDHVNEAVDFMRLCVDIGNCAVSRPAYLAYEFEAAVFCKFKLFDDF